MICQAGSFVSLLYCSTFVRFFAHLSDSPIKLGAPSEQVLYVYRTPLKSHGLQQGMAHGSCSINTCQISQQLNKEIRSSFEPQLFQYCFVIFTYAT